MKEWDEKEVKYLKESYPSNIPIEEICEKLDRSYDSVMKKAQRMFLKRGSVSKGQNKELPFSIDWNNIDECSFFVKKHKSSLKDKLYTTLNS